MNIYLFFRGNYFYTMILKDDQEAIANAECNPGTTRVENLNKKIIWKAKK